ncbi:MAG: Fpg/Nei family DNA glycosylase [Sphingobacteriia bacterium]|nr:Fpg/Nei family DNA glycosylase [Sphingobacteriia bacterium]NCC41321.1 Fpg/Nei family DNA glycosylase [Gammaproteobacteria bacterium]
MPEGDTIHKVAAYLADALGGQQLSRALVWGRESRQLQGRRVLGVTSKGKHMFVQVEEDWTLRVHLGLYGAWHRYPRGQAWRKPTRQASLLLGVADQDYVCFNAKEIEILATTGLRARDRVDRLGPDLTREAPDVEVLMHRARACLTPETELTDLLLDQRIASGIGNVYKSEVLFLEGCAPRTRFDELSSATFAALYRTAGRLLMSNLDGGPRVTRPIQDGRGILWVYRRAGSACLRCGEVVERAMLGRNPRSTYWCPGCQTGPGTH